jgi:hypothetical protein
MTELLIDCSDIPKIEIEIKKLNDKGKELVQFKKENIKKEN